MGVFFLFVMVFLLGVVMFVVYGLVMWYVVCEDDVMMSFFYIGVVGCVVMMVIGVFYWEVMIGMYLIWMVIFCCSGVFGYWFLIKIYEVVEVSVV